MTLPDCMMPDGADPCRGYQELRDRAERAERERDEALTLLARALPLLRDYSDERIEAIIAGLPRAASQEERT